MTNRKRKVALTAGLLAASMAVGFGVATAVAGTDSPEYPSLTDGRTIGTLPTDDKPLAVKDMPDLIKVSGDSGKLGYVTREDFLGGPAPSSPEEALAEQADAKTETIPVYAEDGKTVIDTFTVLGPEDTGGEDITAKEAKTNQ